MWLVQSMNGRPDADHGLSGVVFRPGSTNHTVGCDWKRTPHEVWFGKIIHAIQPDRLITFLVLNRDGV